MISTPNVWGDIKGNCFLISTTASSGGVKEKNKQHVSVSESTCTPGMGWTTVGIQPRVKYLNRCLTHTACLSYSHRAKVKWTAAFQCSCLLSQGIKFSSCILMLNYSRQSMFAHSILKFYFQYPGLLTGCSLKPCCLCGLCNWLWFYTGLKI